MYWLVRQTSFRHIFDIVFAIWRVKVTTLCNFAIQFRFFSPRVCEFAVSINDVSILYNYISTILHTLEILRKLVPAVASVLHFNYLTKILTNFCQIRVFYKFGQPYFIELPTKSDEINLAQSVCIGKKRKQVSGIYLA